MKTTKLTLIAAFAALQFTSTVALAHPSFEVHGHDVVYASPSAADRSADEARERLDRVEASRSAAKSDASRVEKKEPARSDGR